VNLASSLAVGNYRLFVCGTTSILDLSGNHLGGGVDYTFDFAVTTTTGNPSINEDDADRVTASSLPATGFAPKTITTLPAQPANLEYAKLGDLVLEIPSLNVKSTIVGVPQNADNTWDVTWLGNDTGWLNGTAFPTWNGNSVLTAHVTNASGLDGPFAALKSLKYGDQIIVHMGGVQYVYEVRNSRLARPYSTSYAFESKSDAAYLTLITCQGYNPLTESYLFRRVVRAVLVEVK
jgi:LPXTG-site transpeptidase (sortase) family protein